MDLTEAQARARTRFLPARAIDGRAQPVAGQQPTTYLVSKVLGDKNEPSWALLRS